MLYLLYRKGKALFLGIRRYEDGRLALNPSDETCISPKDHLFVIAQHRPHLNWEAVMATA
jgi:hypothetical protein